MLLRLHRTYLRSSVLTSYRGFHSSKTFLAMAEEQLDLLTIGAGGAAYPAAFRLAEVGRSVVMVDPKGVLSGNCLYEGCVPSKAVREMIDTANAHAQLAGKSAMDMLGSDYAAVVKHKDAVQSRRYEQHGSEIQKNPTMRLIKGTAKLTGPHTVEVATDSDVLKFRCRNIIIGSGCSIFVPPFPGSDLCLTSHDLYKPDPSLKRLPSDMVVIGGGYIGLETASFFAAFGTKVTLLQKGETLLNNFDPELTNQLIPLLSKNIDIRVDITVLGVEKTSSGHSVSIEAAGTRHTIDTDVVVVAAGRRPLVPEGCKELGIEVGKKGIVVGPSLQTSAYKHIYACGDVNGRVPLFHAAVRQSLVAAHNILAGDRPVDYADFEYVPNTIFTLPAAACVGITPAIAKAKGQELLRARYDFVQDSRAQIMEQLEGGIELFFEPGTLRLLGGWVVGIDAGMLIGQIGLATAARLTAYDLAKFADQHPMSSEGIGKAARSLF